MFWNALCNKFLCVRVATQYECFAYYIALVDIEYVEWLKLRRASLIRTVRNSGRMYAQKEESAQFRLFCDHQKDLD